MPEEMVKFVVIVPAEYKERLLKVFMKLGLVHLNPQVSEVSLPVPALADERLEELEGLCKSFQELRESLGKAENLLADIVSLKVAEIVLKNENLNILKEIGLPEKSIDTLEKIIEEYDKLRESRPSDELKILIDEMRRTHLAREIVEHVRKYLKDYNKVFEILKLKDASEILEKLEDLKREADELGKEFPEKLDIEELKKMAEKGNKALALLNNLSINVEKAKEKVIARRITSNYDAVIKGLKEYVKLASSILPYESLAKLLLKVHNLVKDFDVVRRVRVSIAEGWIPSRYIENFKELLESTVPRVLYMRIRKALKGEPVPRLIQLKGFRGQIAKITLMRGVPSYWEIDPTLIFTALFTTMYGMMFGDIGLGAIIAVFGILIRRAKEGFLGMSKAGIKALSTLSLLCGVSAIIFGALYGVSFLVEIWKPILLSPLHNLNEIIGMALLFGALQLILSMILNIVNCIKMREFFEAIFGARGVAGLIFYISGVYIAYNIVISGFNLGVAASSSLLPFTAVVIGVMLLIPLTFILKGIMTKHSEYMIHGVIEILELIIEYPANSLSYIRLAAFALAHEAFGILAEALAEFLGYAPSIIFSNVLVLMIEGFAVGIQALRLTYYEFSTKFFKGEGILFEPITVPVSTKTS